MTVRPSRNLTRLVRHAHTHIRLCAQENPTFDRRRSKDRREGYFFLQTISWYRRFRALSSRLFMGEGLLKALDEGFIAHRGCLHHGPPQSGCSSLGHWCAD